MSFNPNIFDFIDPFKLEDCSEILHENPRGVRRDPFLNSKVPKQQVAYTMFFTCSNNSVNYHFFTGDTCEKVLSAKFGLCLVSPDKKNYKTLQEQFTEIANVAYWLAEVPKNIPLLMLCTQSVVKNPTQAELDEADAILVFDESNVFPSIEPILKKSSYEGGGKRKIKWLDDIPRYINEYKSFQYRRNAISNKIYVIGNILNELCFTLEDTEENEDGNIKQTTSFRVRAKYPNNVEGLCMFIEALSYDHLSSASLIKEHTATSLAHMPKQLPDWVDKKVSFEKKHDKPNNASEWRGVSDKIRELIDIVLIWNYGLEEFKITLKGNQCGFKDKNTIMKTGELVGIRSSIEAYYEGVPLADILV